MRTSILPIALLAALPGLAQSNCDLVDIQHIWYSATDANMIEVLVQNNSPELFPYPSFVLVGAFGDTLARETTSFFGIGDYPQAHYLTVEPGASIPSGPFDAALLLYSLFGDSLHCAWGFTGLELCPPDSCLQAEIYLTNTGALVEFEVFWWVFDVNNGIQVATGNFGMDELSATHFDTLCLPPGNYVLELSPFSPIDENYVLGITNSYLLSIGTNVAQQQDSTPLDLAFGWYQACADIGDAIAEQNVVDLVVALDGDRLLIQDPGGSALGLVQLHTLDGRLVRQTRAFGDRAELGVQSLAGGIHVVRVVRPNGVPIVRRFFLP